MPYYDAFLVKLLKGSQSLAAGPPLCVYWGSAPNPAAPAGPGVPLRRAPAGALLSSGSKFCERVIFPAFRDYGFRSVFAIFRKNGLKVFIVAIVLFVVFLLLSMFWNPVVAWLRKKGVSEKWVFRLLCFVALMALATFIYIMISDYINL